MSVHGAAQRLVNPQARKALENNDDILAPISIIVAAAGIVSTALVAATFVAAAIIAAIGGAGILALLPAPAAARVAADAESAITTNQRPNQSKTKSSFNLEKSSILG